MSMNSDKYRLYRVTFTAELVCRADKPHPLVADLHKYLCAPLEIAAAGNFYVGHTITNIEQIKGAKE